MRSYKVSQSLFGIVLWALIFVFGVHSQAQSSPAPSPSPPVPKTPSLERQFFKNILSDQKAIWTSPLHLRRSDARWLVPLAVGTGVLFATDRTTGDEIGEFHAQLNPSRIVSYAGSYYGTGLVLASFYVIGRAKHNERARETGLLGAEALLNSMIVAKGLKVITQRGRPLTGRERSEFFEGGSSFPSGHSIQAWSVATVIANEYHDHRAVQIAAYGIASAVSVSRFTGRKHYLSDVLVGSVMGYGIGQYVYHSHHRKSLAGGEEEEEESRGRSERWPVIAPEYDRRAREYGITLVWSF